MIRCLLSLAGASRQVVIMNHMKHRTPDEYEPILRDRFNFCYKFSKKWQADGLDCVVTPCFPHCAFKHKDAMDAGTMFDYMFLWNILEYPSGSIPVTSVQENEQEYSDSHNDAWTKLLQSTAEGSVGMPINVQVVSYAFEDEKALAVMKSIDKRVNFRLDVHA